MRSYGVGGVLRAHLLSTIALVLLMSGCNRDEPQSRPVGALDQPASRRVIAQGQIMPEGGFIQLGAAPGDIVEKILVDVGDQVTEGQILVVMRSLALREAQKAALVQKRSEAVREQQNAIQMAERQIQAAELQRKQVEVQQGSIARRGELLVLAQQQVEAAAGILQKLEQISGDALTSEFVGDLEVSRQRLSVSEAKLDYQQQVESHRQAREDLELALQAAQAKLESAEALANNLAKSEAIQIIDKQIAALELEEAASQITAPEDGVILAVGATRGEASIQRPLIEMANNARIVCEVEINEMDAAHVQPGQSAKIHSRAFETPLKGIVENKYQLVGRPQLRPLDPLARVDYRAVTAIITLDAASIERAKNWLQLQVEVEIEAPPKS